MAIEYVGGKANVATGSPFARSIRLTDIAGGISSTPQAGDLAVIALACGATANRALTIRKSAIVFVGSKGAGFAGTTSAQSISLTDLSGGIASAPAEGDIVVVAYCVGSTADRSLQINTPSGGAAYTLIGSELYANDSFDTNLRVAYKIMGSTPDTAVELSETGGGTGSLSDAGRYTIHVFRGVDQSTPIDVTPTTATGTNARTINPPSITPTTAGAVVFVTGGAAGSTGGTFAGSELTSERAGSTADTNDAMICSGFIPWLSGALDPAAFTGGGTTTTNDSWAALCCALRPATPSPADYTLAGSELYADDTFDTNLRVAYKFLDDDADLEITFSSAGSTADGMVTGIAIFRGVDPTTPLDVAVQTATGTNTRLANPPSVTPATAGAFVYAAGAAAGGTGGTFTSSDLTEFNATFQAATNDALLGFGYIEWSGSGAVNPAAFGGGGTDTTNDSWAAVTIALRPESDGQTINVNQATETDTAQAMTRNKARALTQATETDTAQPITRTILRVVAQVVETDTAFAVLWAPKHRLVNQAAEADTVQSIARRKTRSISQASETDLAQAVARAKARAIAQATETSTSQPMTRRKARAIAQATETDTPQAMARLKRLAFGQVLETDEAFTVTLAAPANMVNQAVETDTAQAVGRLKAKSFGQATEADSAQALAARRKAKVFGQATETDLSQAVARRKTKILGQPSETDLAQAIARRKTVTLAQPNETDVAFGVTPLGEQIIPFAMAFETDTAQPVLWSPKIRIINRALEADTAQPIQRRKIRALGQSSETDFAHIVTPLQNKIVLLGTAFETDFAQSMFAFLGIYEPSQERTLKTSEKALILAFLQTHTKLTLNQQSHIMALAEHNSALAVVEINRLLEAQ